MNHCVMVKMFLFTCLNIDGTEMSHVTGDGMELEEPSKETEEIAVPPEPELPAEFEKLLKGCDENPEDFNGWVYLLQYVEQEVGWCARDCRIVFFFHFFNSKILINFKYLLDYYVY